MHVNKHLVIRDTVTPCPSPQDHEKSTVSDSRSDRQTPDLVIIAIRRSNAVDNAPNSDAEPAQPAVPTNVRSEVVYTIGP